MSRTAPFVITALVFAAAVAWGLHLTLAPAPFDLSSASTLVIGFVLYGLIAVTGLLLSRGRWARYLSLGLVGSTFLVAVVVEPGPWYFVGLVCSGLAVVGLTGPWLEGWIRRFPSAQGPGPIPTVLVLGVLGLVPLVGVASPSGLELAHGILGGGAVLLGWAYAKAEMWGLWGLRIALPLLGIGAIVASPLGGQLLLAAAVAAITAAAWTHAAGRALNPLLDRLPGPRVATPPERPGA